MASTLGQVEISLIFHRSLGLRFSHAALKVTFDGSLPYSFSSNATWPGSDNYDSIVREAVEQVLRERLGSLERGRVVLESITFDPVSSSPEGFRRAARAVAEAAFSL